MILPTFCRLHSMLSSCRYSGLPGARKAYCNGPLNSTSSLGRQPPTWGTLVSCCRGYPGTVSVFGHTPGYPELSPRVPGWAGRAGVGVPAAYLPGCTGRVWQGVWVGCWLCLGTSLLLLGYVSVAAGVCLCCCWGMHSHGYPPRL
jgi:hypothetical protein